MCEGLGGQGGWHSSWGHRGGKASRRKWLWASRAVQGCRAQQQQGTLTGQSHTLRWGKSKMCAAVIFSVTFLTIDTICLQSLSGLRMKRFHVRGMFVRSPLSPRFLQVVLPDLSLLPSVLAFMDVQHLGELSGAGSQGCAKQPILADC